MMYMPDAIRATIELMEAPADKISVRTSYNLSGMSFSPKIAAAIQQHIPGSASPISPITGRLSPTAGQQSIDDAVARKDWGWKEEFDLNAMVNDMLKKS